MDSVSFDRGTLTRQRLRALLGAMPTPAPLELRVDERVELAGGLVRELITYAVEPGERVAAYLFHPASTRRRSAAVLCLHQHNGEFALGKSEPAGLAGNPEQAYARELAERGYVTLAPDQICFESRRDTTLVDRDFERFELTRRVTLGSSLQAKMTADAMRAVDLLVELPGVDARRIGCIGHSLGGQQTLFLAALDERIAAAASSCGFASLATIFRDRINHNMAAYVPGLAAEGDLGDVLALVAPRPFFVGVGRADRIFPIDGVAATIGTAGTAYARAGVPERLAYVVEPGGHGFTDTLRAQAYAWLDRWLAPAAG